MGNRAPDVLIVGGGVMGLGAALCLARRGVARVTVLEKRFVGAGGSGKSGAILRQHYSNPLTVAMARDGLRAYADFDMWAGGPAGFERVGCLILASAHDRAALEGNVRLMQEAGCAASLVTADDIKRVAPMVDVTDGVLGAWEPDAGYCAPSVVLDTLEKACRQAGVNVRVDTRVVSLRIEGGDRVGGVALESGESLAAGAVILCAGPWTNTLLAGIGQSVPITNTRPSLAFFARPLGLPGHPVIGDLVHEFYCRPDESRTLVGALDLSGDDIIDDPDTYDEAVADDFLHTCRAQVSQRLPSLTNAFTRGGYSGIYDCTPDMHPVIGPLPGIANLYVAAGFSGHGFKLAPVVGRGLAEFVTAGRYETLDLTPLAPTRFAADAPIRARYDYGLLA